MYKYKKERYEMVKNMKNIKTGTYFYNGETYNFNFATDLSAYKKMMFVNYVVNSIVDDDSYDSIVRDLIFDFGLVTICTDIDTSFINVIDNDGNPINPIIFIEQFLEETNVVDIIKVNMEDGIIEQLDNAVNKSIEYRTGIHPSPLNDALASLVATLEKKIGEFDMGNMMDMAQKFAGMTGELTPETIVNAYINSDMHKKNLDEIAESKTNQSKLAEDLDMAIKTVNEEAKSKNKTTKSKSKKSEN